MNKFGMFNTFTAVEGQREQLLQQLLQAATMVEDAAGCEMYLVSTSPTESDVVMVAEIWNSQDDQRASLTNDAIRELIQQTMPLLASMPQQILFTPVGGKGFTA
jgi:quinol monooxygenase YgiN